jgi:hypothetical protein
VTRLAWVAHRYTVYLRNDRAEWSYCDGNPAEETTTCLTDEPFGTGTVTVNNATTRELFDKDGRVVVRSEGWGRDGVCFAAVEVTLARPVSTSTTPPYTQEGGNAQGSNSATGAKIQ